MENQLENSRIQQQRWESIFICSFIIRIFITESPSDGKLILPAFLHSAMNNIPVKAFFPVSQLHFCALLTECWSHTVNLSQGSPEHTKLAEAFPTGFCNLKNMLLTFQGPHSTPKSLSFSSLTCTHIKTRSYFKAMESVSLKSKPKRGKKVKTIVVTFVILLENPFSAFCYVSSGLPQFDIAERWHIKHIHTLFFTVTPISVLPEGNGGRLGVLYWAHINTD